MYESDINNSCRQKWFKKQIGTKLRLKLECILAEGRFVNKCRKELLFKFKLAGSLLPSSNKNERNRVESLSKQNFSSRVAEQLWLYLSYNFEFMENVVPRSSDGKRESLLILTIAEESHNMFNSFGIFICETEQKGNGSEPAAAAGKRGKRASGNEKNKWKYFHIIKITKRKNFASLNSHLCAFRLFLQQWVWGWKRNNCKWIGLSDFKNKLFFRFRGRWTDSDCLKWWWEIKIQNQLQFVFF